MGEEGVQFKQLEEKMQTLECALAATVAATEGACGTLHNNSKANQTHLNTLEQELNGLKNHINVHLGAYAQDVKQVDVVHAGFNEGLQGQRDSLAEHSKDSLTEHSVVSLTQHSVVSLTEYSKGSEEQLDHSIQLGVSAQDVKQVDVILSPGFNADLHGHKDSPTENAKGIEEQLDQSFSVIPH